MSGSELILAECQSGAPSERVAAERLTFDQAFIVHHRLVYRYACGLTRDEGFAEDITQEVFMRLHANIETVQRNGLLRAWLLRVTANVARNAMRGRTRARLRDEAFGLCADRPGELSPDELLIRRDEVFEARRVLAKIDEPMRSCLLLKHEGLTYREISMTLGVHEANVGSLIARARREFVRMFGKIGKR